MKAKIQGIDFEVFPMEDPFEAFYLQPLIAPILLELFPAVVAIVKVFPKEKLAGLLALNDQEVEDFAQLAITSAPILRKAAEQLSRKTSDAAGAPTVLQEITGKLLKNATAGGEEIYALDGKPAFSFKGRTSIIWRLIFMAVKENYADFFPKLRSANGSQAAAPAAPPSGASST